jgi:hypothetical protein
MQPVRTLAVRDFSPQLTPQQQADATRSLEEGTVLLLPSLPFEVADDEQRFLSETWSNGKSKSVYVKAKTGTLCGTRAQGAEREALLRMIERFGASARQLVAALLPGYVPHLTPANASYRPCEAAGRAQSWRHDDTRLHTDAFPSNPTQGRRILRVFANVNPAGRPRVWRVGEPFADMARRFLPRIHRPLPGVHWTLAKLRLTKSPRTEYDHIMLRMHDLQKGDLRYQREVPQQEVEFPAGSTWVCYSDQVMHAAMGGQFLFEQTFSLPVEGQDDPSRSPLRTLERMTGRRLA